MAITLSKTAKALSRGVNQKPQVILEIDGLDTRYGIGTIKRYIRIGEDDLYIDGTWSIGGFKEVPDQEDLISFEGTSTTITQQLLQDKGGTGSVSSLQIALIDKDGKATDLVSPGVLLDDILGAKARIYLGYQDTAFPNDFVEIFSGVIDEASSGATIILTVAHPEAGKRFDIFQPKDTLTTESINYRSATLCGIVFKTRRSVVGTVTVDVDAGGTAGSELVTVVGNAITIAIESGVSTASQIRTAVEKVPAALSLVDLEIVEDQGPVAQSPTALTSLDSDTSIPVVSTEFFLEPADDGTLKTYIRIDDEIIEYTGKTDTEFTGCVRAAYETLRDPRARGDFHENESGVTSLYRLQGNALELALKIMLSSEDEYFLEDQAVSTIGIVPGIGEVENSVYFESINASDRFGLVPGDFMTLTGDLDYPGNNVTLATVSSVNQTENGSYVVLSGVTLTQNGGTAAVAAFKSKYNVLPPEAGLGLGGDQVDVPEFERLMTLYSSSIFDYDFDLVETEKGKDFIDQDLLFPTGAYTLPRKGKISVGYNNPPLSVSALPVLNSENTAKPQNNRIVRSTNKYFYNNVVFKYHPSPLDSSRFLKGNIESDVDSKNQIKVGNKSLIIEARGLRPSDDNDIILRIISLRLLERYRFAAEYIKTQVFFGDSFHLDVGDAVLFGDSGLQLVDTRRGTRGFTDRIFEIVNKSLNIKTGEVQLDLVDTNYLSDGRYGVFSPSTLVATGSTESEIKIKNSFSTEDFELEKDKWTSFIGSQIRVHDDDFTFDETTTLIGFDPTNNYKMLVEPALSTPPTEDMIIDLAEYYGDADEATAAKNQHCFFDPSIPVVSATIQTEVEVSAPNAALIFVGAKVLVHDEDFDVISDEVTVTEIDGTTIKFDNSLGFVPDSTYSLELIGFVEDEGPAYRYL